MRSSPSRSAIWRATLPLSSWFPSWFPGSSRKSLLLLRLSPVMGFYVLLVCTENDADHVGSRLWRDSKVNLATGRILECVEYARLAAPRLNCGIGNGEACAFQGVRIEADDLIGIIVREKVKRS